MKKATILVLDSRREQELENLKRLGLLHPEIERRADERTEALQAQRDLVLRALGELPPEDELPADVVPAGPAVKPPEGAADGPGPAGETLEDVLTTARAIQTAADHRRGRRDVLEKIDAEITRVSGWGEFDPDELRALANEGIEIHLFSMAPRDFRKRAPEGAIVLERGPVAVRFALVWYQAEHTEGFRPSSLGPDELAALPGITRFRIPDISLSELRRRREQELAEIGAAEQQIASLAGRRNALEWGRAEIERRLRDEQVRLGMDTAERIAWITGYIPADSVDSLAQAASNNGWGTLVRDPEPDDQVPTKIKNPGWIRIIKPVFSLLGVVPG
ncbi:MAG: hypothetical protein ACOC1I_03675, partial [Spirochaetota bacterium]